LALGQRRDAISRHDDYLAGLNVLVDHLGGLVDLVGLCQGGWLSLVYAGDSQPRYAARYGGDAG